MALDFHSSHSPPLSSTPHKKILESYFYFTVWNSIIFAKYLFWNFIFEITKIYYHTLSFWKKFILFWRIHTDIKSFTYISMSTCFLYFINNVYHRTIKFLSLNLYTIKVKILVLYDLKNSILDYCSRLKCRYIRHLRISWWKTLFTIRYFLSFH